MWIVRGCLQGAFPANFMAADELLGPISERHFSRGMLYFINPTGTGRIPVHVLVHVLQ